MAEDVYQINFSGEIAPGFEADSVKLQIAKLFKANDKQIEIFFSGKKVVVKNKVDLATAKKYYATLAKLGAVCQVQSMSTGETISISTAKAQSSSPQDGGNVSTANVKPRASFVQVSEPTEKKPQATRTEGKADSPISDAHKVWSSQVEKNAPNWGLAAAGAPIDSIPRHKEYVNPDISNLSLAEQNEQATNSKQKPPLVNIDVSHLSILDD